jgi:hypothetical protein
VAPCTIASAQEAGPDARLSDAREAVEKSIAILKEFELPRSALPAFEFRP